MAFFNAGDQRAKLGIIKQLHDAHRRASNRERTIDLSEVPAPGLWARLLTSRRTKPRE
jgi:hypothetical protein